MSQANVEIARRLYESAARGDLIAIRGFLDSHVKWHGGDVSAPEACRSREDVLAFIEQAHRRGAIGPLVEVIGAGERVVVVFRSPSTPGGDFELRANLAHFRHGKVIEMVAYESSDAALAATRA